MVFLVAWLLLVTLAARLLDPVPVVFFSGPVMVSTCATLGGVVCLSRRGMLQAARPLCSTSNEGYSVADKMLPALMVGGAAAAVWCWLATAHLGRPGAPRLLGMLLSSTAVADLTANLLYARERRRPVAGVHRALLPFVLVDTAAPLAVVAAVYGGAFAWLRFASVALNGPVSPRESAHHLAFSMAFYATVVGGLSLAKAYREVRRGFVVLPPSTMHGPSPFGAFLLLAATVYVLAPAVLPPMGLWLLVSVKAITSALAVFVIASLGAVQGARLASVARAP